MRVLITGSSGLTGSFVKAHLLHQGHEVYAPSSRELDLSGSGSLEINIPTGLDAVVHLASHRDYRSFPDAAVDTVEVNIRGTARLLELARDRSVSRFVFASTGGVYRNTGELLQRTSPILRPENADPYFASKIAAESWVMAYRDFFDVSILRPFTIYGHPANPQTLVPRLIRAIKEGQEIQLSARGGDVLRPTHVSDVARVVVACLEGAGTHIINVGGPDTLTVREVADQIGMWVGERPKFGLRPEAPRVLAPTLDDVNDLGVPPIVRFGDGLRIF